MKSGLRHNILVIFILFLFVNTITQNVIAEEEPVNPHIQLEDTRQKVDSINDWIIDIYKSFPHAAQKHGNEAYQIALRLNYTEGQKSIAHSLGNAYKQSNKIDSALYFTNKYIQLAESTNDSMALAKGYFQMSKALISEYGVDTALQFIFKADGIFQDLGYERGQMVTANTLGNIYLEKTMYDEAVFYYLEALMVSERLDYIDGIGATLNNLGKVYLLMEEDSVAKEYFLKSIPFNVKSGNLANESIAYTNLGVVEMKHKNYDSAMVYFDKSLQIHQKRQDIIGENNAFINMGSVHFLRKEYGKAIEKFDQSIELLKNINYPKGFITALSSKAQVLSKLGLSSQALALLDSSYVMAQDYNILPLQQDILKKYFDYYIDRGDFKNAVGYQKKYYGLKDAIWNGAKKKNIQEYKIIYEHEKDQARILNLINENLEKDLQIRKRTNQRNIYLFTSAGIILIAVFIFIFLRIKSRNDSLMAMQKIRQLEKDKKLISAQFLLEGQEEERKRIAKELHDGIGVLLSTAKMQFTSIDGISPVNRPKINNATKLLEMAATEVRKITHNMMPGLLSKYGFFEAIDDLIEQINETGTLKAEMIVEGGEKRFPEQKEFMLYRIVQEMINNTIKHAEATEAILKIKTEDKCLFLEYKDNGKGFNVEEKFDQKSIGLTSIKSRSEYLGGKINILSSPGNGTTFTLKVSIK